MHVQEVILCATAATSSTSGSGCVAIHDLQTGTSLASFKQTNSAVHCTSHSETKNGQGGFILAAQTDKSLLNVYNFQKDQMASKIVLPEKLCCTAVEKNGRYFAGGTAGGRIFLWEVASGILYNSWDAHYRCVTVLCFTPDGTAILSGSEDSGVSVWSVQRLLDNEYQSELVTPLFTFSDHTLPITDIACGVGSFPRSRALTCSLDHSVKLWDLSSQSLLTTFQFPHPITCLVWDPAERSFFSASNNGTVYETQLFEQTEQNSVEAVGGSGVADVIRVTSDTPNAHRKTTITIDQPITSLAISLTASLLLVGLYNGCINIYDIPSHQLLRTITTQRGFSITYLATMLKPPDLVGHISLSLHVGSSADAKDIIPVKPVLPFHRTKDPRARDAHEVHMLLPTQDYYHEVYSNTSFLKDHAFFVQPSLASISHQDPISLQGRVNSLEAEVAELKDQLGKAKGVNDQMWENVVQRVILNKDKEVEDLGNDRSRKRLRS